MKVTKKSIDAFLAPRKLAIAGVSRDPKKFGFSVFKELKEKGFEVIPINPEADNIDGTPCLRHVSELPDDVSSLLIITPRSQTPGIVTEALERKLKNIWIQQMSETPETLILAKTSGVNLIYKQCILMYTDPVKGIHKFHRNIKRFFGRLPN
ncbi:MAG: CoA-binding protein [Bacteroidales bacterium]|jgi:hypothetical protein|nr:CoA-binding protein [Bacteroidales bacterium]